MPRKFVSLYVSIWSDPPFVEGLTRTQQGLYMFLISQPELSVAGVLPLTVRRWARKAKELPPGQVQADLDALAAARFVVVDEATDELLVRSFMRRNEVCRQPNMMRSLPGAVELVQSPVIRDAIHAELVRIESESRPGLTSGPRAAFDAALRAILGVRSPSPGPIQDGLFGGVGEGSSEGSPKGSGKGSEEGGRDFGALDIETERLETERQSKNTRARPRSLPNAFGADYADGAVRRYATDRGMDERTLERELIKFQNYHLERGTTSPAWERRWLTWVMNWEERNERAQPEEDHRYSGNDV